MDYNVRQDTLAAKIVWERCDPVVVQFSVSLEASLRETHLPRLREGGSSLAKASCTALTGT